MLLFKKNYLYFSYNFLFYILYFSSFLIDEFYLYVRKLYIIHHII